MPVRTPPPTRACEVCYTPVPLHLVADQARPRCARHEGVVRLSERAVVTVPDAPRLRRCPSCGGETFRAEGVCSRCDRDVPALRGPGARNNSPPKRKRRRSAVRSAKFAVRSANRPSPRPSGFAPFRSRDGRIVPDLARVLAATPAAERRVSGLLVSPDPPGRRGNRCRPGASVTAQAPARAKALALMSEPGSWEVLAFYARPERVKAAVWYLRHRVEPTLPAGRWEFARCWWERSAVMGRYTPV